MDASEFKVLYLTGAPATGKSTLCSEIQKIVPALDVFQYGKELTDFLNKKYTGSLSQSQLREQSARVATREDIEALDAELINRVHVNRKVTNIVIDSHAVTKEEYGFRVTPFSLKNLIALKPSSILVLYTDSASVQNRVEKNPQGRPALSAFELDMHTNLQASVAITYSIQVGIPLYFFDSGIPSKDLAVSVAKKFLGFSSPTAES